LVKLVTLRSFGRADLTALSSKVAVLVVRATELLAAST